MLVLTTYCSWFCLFFGGGGRGEGSGLRLILGGTGKRQGGDQMIGISGIYTEKIILFCLISDQGRKKSRDGMVGIYRGIQPRSEFMERKKNLL